MKFLAGIVVGAIVGALIGYAVWGRQVGELEPRIAQLERQLAEASAPPPAPAPAAAATTNPRAVTMTVSGAVGSDCTVKFDQPKVGNKRRKRVLFIVDSEDAQCGEGNWRVQLRFKNIPPAGGNPEIVYNATANPLNIPRDDFRRVRIADMANVGKFPYEIWYVQPNGREYMMLDPELEIEP